MILDVHAGLVAECGNADSNSANALQGAARRPHQQPVPGQQSAHSPTTSCTRAAALQMCARKQDLACCSMLQRRKAFMWTSVHPPLLMWVPPASHRLTTPACMATRCISAPPTSRQMQRCARSPPPWWLTKALHAADPAMLGVPDTCHRTAHPQGVFNKESMIMKLLQEASVEEVRQP